MRWQVKEDIVGTKEESIIRNGEQVGTKEITTKRKYKVQYITVGDIVGMGKSAAGAVNKLAKKIPQLIRSFKTGISNAKNTFNSIKDGDPASINMMDNAFTEAALVTVNNLVQPLNIMIKGMDIYKKVMTVVDAVTPIVKTVARTTGIWCSPGNVADIAQIVLGQVKQALIGIAISALMELKEWVWAFEFPIKTIDLGTSQKIIEKLKKAAELQKGKKILGDGENDKSLLVDFKNKESNIKDSILNLFGDNKVLKISEDDLIYDDASPEEYCKFSVNNFITEEIVDNNKRVLSGSLNNEGIFYSDDNQKTWKRSNQITGSFKKFAKLKVGDKYIYVAGSTNKVLDIKPTTEVFLTDEYGRYNKDYYNKEGKRLTKIQKDKGLSFWFEIKEEIPAIGLLWSDDGINWNQSDITSGKFEELYTFTGEGAASKIVASSFDYNGIYYTEDGKNWIRSFREDGKEIINGRWINFSDSQGTDPMLYVRGMNLKSKNTSKLIRITRIDAEPVDVSMEINSKSFGYDLETYLRKEATIMDIIKKEHKNGVPAKTREEWAEEIKKLSGGSK